MTDHLDRTALAADLAVVRDQRADWRQRRNAHDRLKAKALDMADALTDHQDALFDGGTAA